MTYLFRLFLIVNSLSLSFFIFAVNKGFTLDWITNLISDIKYIDINYYNLFSYIFYIASIIILSLVIFYFIRFLDDDNIEQDTIINIEPANDNFLPTYLGYFFVALSIGNIELFFVVFGIITLFICYSNISYFNPIFSIFGYKFFYITNSDNVKLFLITKKELKKAQGLSFENLKRITNYTFIDME